MPGSFIPLALWFLLTASTDSLEPPPVIVGEAIRAVEGDSVSALEARWKVRVNQDSTDRSALFGLATLARLQYRYPAAEELYARVLAGDTVATERLGAYALLGLAQGLDAQGFNEKAVAAISRARGAARSAGDSAAEGEALLVMSLQRAFGQGIEAGLATLDTVERLVPATRFDLHAMRMRQRAALRGIVGRPEARGDAREALALARKSGLQRLVGEALKSEAQLLQFEGKRDSSIQVLQQAEAMYRRAHDRVQLGSTLLWHVNALLGQGDLGEANKLVHLALEEGRASSNQFAVATAFTAAGSIALSLNDYPTAASDLDSSVALFKRLGDPAGEMKARDYLAVTALAAGDIAGARRQAEEVLKWYERTGEQLIQFSAHRNLAIIAMRERNWAAAEQALGNAHALARRMNRPLWTAELSYDDGRLALLRGHLAAAERSLSKYLATLDTSQHVFRHDARVRRAEIHARRGDLTRAEREATEAWDELDRWRATLTDTELRILAFQASPVEMNDRDAELVRLLGEIAARGRAATAFELAERRRARELADHLAQADALRAGDSTGLTSRDAPKQAERGTVASVVTQIPDDNTAILEYVTGSYGAPTTLFLLSRGPPGAEVQAIPLPPADSLEQSIARFAALIQSGDRSDALAESLGEALLRPAVELLRPGVRRLIIVPDGPLHRLPFDALRVRGRYAVEQYTLSLAPSAGVLATLWRQGDPSPRPMRLLAFGDPAFSEDAPFPRLRRSGREARLVARYSPESEVRLHQDANAAYLRRADLVPFRVIHFATHTLVDEHTAARTALVLAPKGGDEGRVDPGELASLRLKADLVVLSSCRSAGGVVVNGEGVQGLIAPLLQAGARSVVATQWEIGDRGAVQLVELLYRQLAKGQPVGDALRLAKLEAIEKGAPPHEWAAFTVLGDPLAQVPLRAPRWWQMHALVPLIIGAAGAVLVLLYGARRRRGRTGDTS